MTARIDPAQLGSTEPLRGSPVTTQRAPRVWPSLSRADQAQLASTLAEMARRVAAGAAAEPDDVDDHGAR
jgi:hypothetical protein